MGRVWLCEGKTAGRPFCLEAEGISLYSLEELCYYLYQNAELVGESFFHEGLCQWLEEELGEASLSQEIRAGIDRGESGCWCLGRILEAGGFYSQEELQQVLKGVAWMEDKGPLERAKLRGDRLLRDGKCREAVLAYRKALSMAGDGIPWDGGGVPDISGGGEGMAEGSPPSPESRTVGRIWHNMGTAYAYHLLFAQAAYCFGRAYEAGQEEVSKRDYLIALSCQEGKVPEGGTDTLAEAQKELEAKKRSGDRAGYEERLEQILELLIAEYRESE